MSKLFPLGPQAKIPLWLKLVYTAFVIVFVPFYLKTYGPTNFLYFCDMSLLFGLVALWTESSLLASMPAVGILLPQILWCVDFGAHLLGFPLLGMTSYMFNADIPLFARSLSLFHGWLPFVLVFMVYRLGYDRRALAAWTCVACALVVVCYFFMPAPPAPANDPNLPVNINYVFNPLGDSGKETFMPQIWWFITELVALPLLVFVPTHLVLSRFMPARKP